MGILKLGGIASGMDTEGLITTLMNLERRPLQTLQTRQSKFTTEANAWRDLNTRMLTLKTRFDDLKGLADGLWTAKKATPSDTTVLTATAAPNAAAGSYTVNVTALAKATQWQSGVMSGGPRDDANEDLGLSGTIRVASGPKAGETFAVSATDSLTDIAATINANKADLGFSASVVQVNPGDYRLVIKGETGTTNDFALENDGADTLADALGLTAVGGAVKNSTAANGSLTVNGVTVTTASNSVTDAIGGTTLTLLKEGATTTVTVGNDTQKIVDAVRKFVDQYNAVVDFIATQTRYDTKTKDAGTLFGEDRVLSIRDSLSTKMMDPVAGVPDAHNSLVMVGVTTEAYQSGQKVSGKLVFNAEKFAKALEADPASVKKLLTGSDGTTKGIAIRATEWLDNYTRSGGILPGLTETLEKSAASIKERITNFETQILPMRENRLRAQFTALEKAMATYQNQGTWLSGQIKSLASSSGE